MISFRIAGGTFTARPLPTLLTFVMLAVLIALGTWQVQRLQWKQDLIAHIKTQMAEPPLDVARIPADQADYHPASASGLLHYDKELYLTAISLDGQGGYRILTPMQLEDGRSLLVDRGWVPYDHKDPATRIKAQLAGAVQIKGILRIPAGHRWMQPADDPAQNQWYGIDLAAMAKAADMPAFLPYVLEADATPNPGGYPVGGQTRIDLPNNHFSYILTWYGLALVLLAIYAVQGWRRDIHDSSRS